MYVRLLRIAMPDEALVGLRSFYVDKVLPVLASSTGCVFASLLEPSLPVGHCLSLTVWRSQDEADEYEHSGRFAALVDEMGQRLGASRARESAALPALPVLDEYQLLVGSRHLSGTTGPGPLHLRLVSMLVQSGRQQELADIYRDDVLPALEATAGCLGAFLLQGVDNPETTLSVTLWERDEDAVRYELSGSYDELVGRLRRLLSGLYRWRLAGAPGGASPLDVGADQLDVHRYRVVAGGALD